MTAGFADRELLIHNKRCSYPQWVEIDEDWPKESISLNGDLRRPTWASLNYCLNCGTLWSRGHVIVPMVSMPSYSEAPA